MRRTRVTFLSRKKSNQKKAKQKDIYMIDRLRQRLVDLSFFDLDNNIFRLRKIFLKLTLI